MAVGSQRAAATMLRGWRLEAARAACLGVAVLTLGLVAAGFAAGFRDPELISQPTIRTVLVSAGVPLRLTIAIGLLVPTVVSAVTAAVLFWRRFDDWMALLFGLFLVLFGSFESRALYALHAAHPGARPLIGFVSVATLVVGILLLSVFPDGRFVPGSTRLLALAVIPAFGSMPDMLTTVQRLPDPLGVPAWREAYFLAVLVGSAGLGIAAQGWRYWRVSGPVQRQQAKWVLFAFVAYELVLLGGFAIPSLFVNIDSPWFAWALVATLGFNVLFPVAVAVAILRYRLYAIDRILNRTLVYGLLTAILGTSYALVVLGLGQLAGTIGSGTHSLAIAGATLAVAVGFRPLRRRVQDMVDRRFNRRRYDAAQTITQFSSRLRQELDLDALTRELLEIVDQTMQPTRLSLWLRPTHNTPPRTTHSAY
jgi:hypothetical protein